MREHGMAANITNPTDGTTIRVICCEDKDGMFRWYEAETDNDTEVSCETWQGALTQAENAWRRWDFTLITG